MKNMLSGNGQSSPLALVPGVAARCPACLTGLLLERTNKKTGERFLGCSNFSAGYVRQGPSLGCKFAHKLPPVETFGALQVLHDFLAESGKLELFPQQAVIWLPHHVFRNVWREKTPRAFRLSSMINGYIIETIGPQLMTNKNGTKRHQIFMTHVGKAIRATDKDPHFECCGFQGGEPAGMRRTTTPGEAYREHYKFLGDYAAKSPGWARTAPVQEYDEDHAYSFGSDFD